MGRRIKARALDRSSPVPLWSQLETDLQRRLEAGGFAEAFPGEYELVEEYQVSRHTVRQALRGLRADGIIDSGRGRGSTVSKLAIEQPLGAIYSLFTSVEATGATQNSMVRALDTRLDPRVADRLHLPPNTDFVFLERLRLAEDEPLAVDRSWLVRAVAEPVLGGEFTHSALYDELARLAGIRPTGGHEVIRAVVPDAATRKLLGVAASTAALAIERVGRLDQRPVEFRESLIRGDRFSLTAQWSGPRGYRLDVTGTTGRH